MQAPHLRSKCELISVQRGHVQVSDDDVANVSDKGRFSFLIDDEDAAAAADVPGGSQAFPFSNTAALEIILNKLLFLFRSLANVQEDGDSSSPNIMNL